MATWPISYSHYIIMTIIVYLILVPDVVLLYLKQQMTLVKAQAGVKNNMRRMNKSIIQNGSNHVLHVVLFALFCFFVVYFWSKISRR
ncbi:bet1-like protein [Iris pallida]|uniref:Bet1-like protein n=1 Tax=Iris pallida TaxID=29817 RepID=A0AAX6DIX9_IRIPA|nr:bet1-like protein [Iris pallida]